MDIAGATHVSKYTGDGQLAATRAMGSAVVGVLVLLFFGSAFDALVRLLFFLGCKP